MHSEFTTPITNLEQAKALLKLLYEQGRLYHPEDSAQGTINGTTGNLLFTPGEAAELDKRTHEMYQLDWNEEWECPCDYALHLDPDYARDREDELPEDPGVWEKATAFSDRPPREPVRPPDRHERKSKSHVPRRDEADPAGGRWGWRHRLKQRAGRILPKRVVSWYRNSMGKHSQQRSVPAFGKEHR